MNSIQGPDRSDGERPLLGAYAAKTCARRIHNEFDRTVPDVDYEPTDAMKRLFEEGIAFERTVLDELGTILGPDLVRIAPHQARGTAIAQTVQAMRDSILVIAGGWLPDDIQGGRQGRPDLLLRLADDNGTTYYAPGDIKAHKNLVARKTKSAIISTPVEPPHRREVTGWAESVSERFDDFIQLAHYSRMLDAAGFGPKDRSRPGFIIGRDVVEGETDESFLLVWHELTTPQFSTYSASQGTKKRSALERYDHEHGFRLDVAAVALQRTGKPSDPLPLVVPVGQEECLECPYKDYCSSIDSDVASFEISSGRLSIREWLTLQQMGVTSTLDLAQVDVSDKAWMEDYSSRVSHKKDALERLANAVLRARMLQSGTPLVRLADKPFAVPSADVEIDFDVEWDSDEKIYLWGARIRSTADDMTPEYVSFVDWGDVDDGGLELARNFAMWLRGVVTEATAAGQTVTVYHYTSPEKRYLENLLGKDHVADLTKHFIDLHALIKRQFFGFNGLGLKMVAKALGFAWQADDAGGLQSQTWLEIARDTSHPEHEAMRDRILAYNEDDVTATAIVRDRISAVSTTIDQLEAR